MTLSTCRKANLGFRMQWFNGGFHHLSPKASIVAKFGNMSSGGLTHCKCQGEWRRSWPAAKQGMSVKTSLLLNHVLSPLVLCC